MAKKVPSVVAKLRQLSPISSGPSQWLDKLDPDLRDALLQFRDGFQSPGATWQDDGTPKCSASQYARKLKEDCPEIPVSVATVRQWLTGSKGKD